VSSTRIEALLTQLEQQKQEEERLLELERQRTLEREQEARAEELRRQEKEEFERRQEELQAQQLAAETRNRQQLQDQLLQLQTLEQQKEEQRRAEREEYQRRQDELAREQLRLETAQREEFNRILQTTLMAQEEGSRASGTMNMIIIAVIAVLGVVIILGFIAIVFIIMKHSQQQQQSFDYTINSIRTLQTDQLALGDGSTGGPRPLLLEEGAGQGAGQENPGSEKLRLLMETCKSYGTQIDDVTGRKNASKNVGELVFKISKAMGYRHSQSMLHYMAALVHDIGFLNIDPDLFKKEVLSAEEFETIQKHTKIGTQMIHFVEKDLQPVFYDAILYHHENMDGSGYPEGLSGDEIPFVARAIRVAESYVALISSRLYKKISDKESAIEELMKNEGMYELTIVETLNDIV